MKPRNTISIVLLIGLLSAMFTLNAYAQRGKRFMRARPMQNGPSMMKAPGMGPRIFRQLDLTDEQQQKIKQIMQETRQKIIPLRNQMREARAHLRTLMTKNSTDQATLQQQAEKIGNIRTQIMKQRLATHHDIRNVLDKEQRIWFDSRSHFMGKANITGRRRGGMKPLRGAGKRGMGQRGVCPWMK